MKKYSFVFSMVALFVVAGIQFGYCVVLNGVNVPKDKLICYLFIGHSNMEGYGGIPDTVTNPRVWAYSETLGFWNARDPVETTYNSPSPFMPFLKKMADLYPDYYFCGIKVTQAGMSMSSQFLRNMPKYTQIMQTVGPIKDSVTLGGIIAMFGWLEGSSDSLSQCFDVDVNTMLSEFREDLGIPDLPMIMGRYEQNADTTKQGYTQFYTYRSRMIAQLEQLQSTDSLQHRIMLTPFLPVPKTMYYDDHHYNADGYNLWSNTGAEILYSSNWNSWYPIRSSPLKMLFPSGGEVFAFTDSIPITWMCDPESLSVVLISLTQDSGKTWSYINGEPLKSEAFPWSKTFYWTPSKSGLTFTTGVNLGIEIDDYSGRYSCRSNAFSLDSMPTGVRESRVVSYTGGFKIAITRTTIFVSLPRSNDPLTVALFSIAGKTIYAASQEAHNGALNIPTSRLSTGTYLMSITGGNTMLRSSFVVTK
jgi:hypothetical protein